MRARRQGRRTPAIAAACLAGAGLLLAWAVGARADGIVRSSLDRPDRAPPPFLVLGPSVGDTRAEGGLRPGFSGGLVLTPAAGAEIFPPLYDLNLGLVLHGEYRGVAQGRDLVAAGLVARRYFRDQRRESTPRAAFVGLGLDIAQISFPGAAAADSTAEATAAGELRNYSGVLEGGWELRPSPRTLIVALVRWRRFIDAGFDYSGWSCHLQAGFPIPW
ncbi:MAG: hypothetical protein IPH09_08640 [bacterium]|nr:hypothetical protein [bacterium]